MSSAQSTRRPAFGRGCGVHRASWAHLPSHVVSIRAVIWDFGGVLSSSPFEAFARYERERGLPHGFIRGLNATNPDFNAWARLERAELDLAGFCAAFEEEARAAGGELDGSEVLALLAGDIRPRMIEA